ncbi:hypothetical protein L6164_023080 [Bauhinia variegata]|uniref:Uncharacterized protein n=1 Tax=Bauhinia variegata TaxID=167791 RepID=A0ACB9MHL4_BAUVA|nr:hypothetical protein L6164_023080 [Bauhinia variegata]
MARLINTTLVLVLAVTVTLLLCSSNNVVEAQCKGDVEALITQCEQYVEKSAPKMDPSPACCNVVKGCDVPCLCKHIPKKVMEYIDMDKVEYVAKFCGSPLPPGTKCGGNYNYNHIN